MRPSSRPLLLALALAVVACAQRPASPPVEAPRATPVSEPSGRALEVRYLANEGFLVRSGDQRVLIDGLFGDGIAGYPALPAEQLRALEAGADWAAGIRVGLASHHHGDHFDPAAVERFLIANPRAVFVSTPQAAESFRRANPDSAAAERFQAVLPAPGEVEALDFDGVRITALNLHHGRRTPPVENLGFIVELAGGRVIHFGDTEAKMEDFEPYLHLLVEPEVALMPFWFLSSEWRAAMLRDLVRPRTLVVAHLPRKDAPVSYFARWRTYDALRATIEAAFPDAWIPEGPGALLPDELREPTSSPIAN